MRILSHRGLWKTPEEKNTAAAFKASFESGFGTETDFRDFGGTMVVSHDPPSAPTLEVDPLLQLLSETDASLPLAINIKADGLQSMIVKSLQRHALSNYFLFDMSVPDAILSLRAGLSIFTRQSDVEPEPVLYKESCGVWLDAFYSHEWITADTIKKHLEHGKRVCVVSPELHHRDHAQFWSRLSAWNLTSTDALMLCTDFPHDARSFFSP